MRHKFQLAWHLSWREWFILLEAWWRLMATSLALRRVSYDRFLFRASSIPGKKDPSSNGFEVAQRLQQLVWMASRLHAFRVTCLVRALTLYRMLVRRGIRSKVCIGVSIPAEGMEAHAWVEVAGTAIGEAEDITEKYKVLGPVIG
jgi:hypothetical protein